MARATFAYGRSARQRRRSLLRIKDDPETAPSTQQGGLLREEYEDSLYRCCNQADDSMKPHELLNSALNSKFVVESCALGSAEPR